MTEFCAMTCGKNLTFGRAETPTLSMPIGVNSISAEFKQKRIHANMYYIKTH